VISTIALTLTKFVGKTAETSLRRALGASRRTIFNQQIVEVGMIGFTGGLIGLLLVTLGLQGIEYLYESPGGLVRLDGLMVVAALGIAVVSSMVAGLYPAWRVCRIPPASQLKTQ
jgi:putative ABC transport system permease protein